MAIQIAKEFGGIPIAVVSSEDKFDFCLKLGAKGCINRKEFDHWGMLPHWTDNEAFGKWAQGARAFGAKFWEVLGERRSPRIVFEHPGEDTIPTSIFMCDTGGMVVICAGTSGFNATVDLRYLWMRQKRLQGSHFANDEQAGAFNQTRGRRQDRPLPRRDVLVRGHREVPPADVRGQAAARGDGGAGVREADGDAGGGVVPRTRWTARKDDHRVRDNKLTAEQLMTLLAEAPRRIAALTAGLAPARLHAAPNSDEWSANDVLAHLRACADVWGGSIVTMVREDHPTIRAISPRTWIHDTDYPDREFAPSLQAYTRSAPSSWRCSRRCRRRTGRAAGRSPGPAGSSSGPCSPKHRRSRSMNGRTSSRSSAS